jgi:hypothetical protein
LLIDDTETGRRIVSSYSTQDIKATESGARPYPDPDYPKDYYARVDWTYTSGNDRAHATMSDTDKLSNSRHFTDISPAQEATLNSLGIDENELWYTRYDADIALDPSVSGLQASGTGKGSLEGAQFGLASAPPKGCTTPTP